VAALLTWFCMSRAGVGKSCLLLRFSDDSFTPSFITTIGYVAAGDATAAGDGDSRPPPPPLRQSGLAWVRYFSYAARCYAACVRTESTSRSARSSSMASVSNCRSGILLVRSASAQSPQVRRVRCRVVVVVRRRLVYFIFGRDGHYVGRSRRVLGGWHSLGFAEVVVLLVAWRGPSR